MLRVLNEDVEKPSQSLQLMKMIFCFEQTHKRGHDALEILRLQWGRLLRFEVIDLFSLYVLSKFRFLFMFVQENELDLENLS